MSGTRQWACTLAWWVLLVLIPAPASAGVTMSVVTDWGNGFQAELTIRNDSAQPIAHWRVEFDFAYQISSIWNAEIAQHAGTRYVIRHPAWRDTIGPGETVQFGFIAAPGNVTALPTAYTVRGDEPVALPPPPPPTPTPPPSTPPGAENARITFQKTTDWGTGYNAEIVIRAPSSSGLNGWRLEFDLADTITTLWNGVVVSAAAGHYVVRNADWNGAVAPGASATIGFGVSVSLASGPPSRCTLNGAACTFEVAGIPPGTPPATPPVTPPGGGSGIVVIAGVDEPSGATLAPQLTVPQGTTTLAVSVVGNGAAHLTAATNNPAVATAVIDASGRLQITAKSAGRAALRLTESATNTVRHVGVRVRNLDGSLPGVPGHVMIGSVSEDTPGDLALWRNFGTGPTNTRVDLRYIYLNGGPFDGWFSWAGGNGNRATGFIRESKKLGMIPVFVYYNIPDGGESYFTDTQHIGDAAYMAAYFKDLKRALDIIRTEGGDDPVGIVLEPDFIGYLMQLSGRQPHEIPAQVGSAYTAGILTGSDPRFPDTVTGLVQAINYLIAKHAPNAVFGWQFNLWASLTSDSEIPASGLMRITDSLGIAGGRARIRSEAARVADYYIAAGVLSHGAHFVSIDKYGLDGGFGGSSAPWSSTWFWNAIHWNNYLLFARGLNERTARPVVLWQIPVGHVNHSLAPNPYEPGGVFADLPNTYQRYEDSAPTYFLGDVFTTADPQRLAYFGAADPEHPSSVSVNGSTITWASHMAAARDAGVIAVLFGDGVGESTHGRGSPPPDGGWFISKVQSYYDR